jgi:nitric oxide synthase-interacting protein
MLIEPLACSKGHLFCKSCIIENMVIQKAEIKNRVKEWEEEVKSRQTKSNEAEILKQKELLRDYADKIIELGTADKSVDYVYKN